MDLPDPPPLVTIMSYRATFDCSVLYHTFDTHSNCDVHQIVPSNQAEPGYWADCDENLCPNCYLLSISIPENISENGRFICIPVITPSASQAASQVPTRVPSRVGQISNPTSARASPAYIPTTLPSVEQEPAHKSETKSKAKSDHIEADSPETEMSNITLADLTKAIKDLADSQDSFKNIVADMAHHSNSNKGVSKPQNYDGKCSNDA